jgi:hypothetical protein
MAKVRIAIDIEGVLRDTFEKIEQIYQKFFIDELELVDDEFKFEIYKPYNTNDYRNHFNFKNDDEYYNFMFNEFTMQIFGHAPSTEMGTFHILNEIYKEYFGKVEFLLISKQVGKSKPATLFFVSKFGCEIEKIVFYNNKTKNKIWKEFDILLTTDPELLQINKNKTLIKFEKPYNSDIKIKYSISSITELSELVKNLI